MHTMIPPPVLTLTLHWHPTGIQRASKQAPGWTHRHPLRGLPPPKLKRNPRHVFCRVKEDSINSADQDTSTIEGKDEEEEDSFPGSEILDSLIEKQRKNLEKAREAEAEFKEVVRAAELSGYTPKAYLAFLRWLQGLNSSSLESEIASLAKLESQRVNLKSKWRQLETLAPSPEKPVGGSNPVEEPVLEAKEEQAIIATALVISSFIFPFSFSYVASLFGIDLSMLMKDGEFPSAEAIATWAAWSLPYVGGTVIAGAIAPRWIGNKGTLRLIDDDKFQSELPLITLASVSMACGYSQAVVHQGVWYLCLLNFLAGGSNVSVGDPMYSEELLMQQSLGSLVAVPSFWKLFSKPAAVVLSSLLEAGWWFLSDLFSINEEPSLALLSETSRSLSAEQADERPQISDMMTLNWNQGAWQPTTWLTAGRVFTSSLWLGTETVMTGNLWYPICTGGLGIFVGILARRSVVLNAKRDSI